MAILEAKMVQIDEIFLSYILDRTGCRTFFEAYRENAGLLGCGQEEGKS
ncbi:hypothetical protein [Faecousia sp.]